MPPLAGTVITTMTHFRISAVPMAKRWSMTQETAFGPAPFWQMPLRLSCNDGESVTYNQSAGSLVQLFKQHA